MSRRETSRHKGAGARRLPTGPAARLLRGWDLVGLVVAVVLIVGLVGFFTVGPGARADRADPEPGAAAPHSDGTASAPATDPATEAASPSAYATRHVRRIGRVVGGLSIERIPTPAELIARMDAEGYEPTDPDESSSFTFEVASFNILGASHRRPGVGSGVARMGPAMSMLRAQGVSVAGIQEFQPPQISRFFGLTGGSWGIYPGLQLGRGIEGHNSVIWDKGVWELVEARTTRIPYFGGQLVRMPHVLLQHRASGERVWFGNYHNPADTRGNAAGHRARAVAIEAGLVRDLTSDGTPMIVTGDMNARGDFACPFTRASGMHSADGARTSGGRCELPRRVWIDWILGSPDITFSGYLLDQSPVRRRISDHPLITSTATVETELDTSDCLTRRSTEGKQLFCPR